MKRPARPFFIRHWRELESVDQIKPPAMDEPFGYVAEFAPAANIAHLRVAHMRLPPGVRGYPPVAMRNMEVFAFVLEGAPELWLDGHLYVLKEGDAVCLAARTGIAHSLLNNGETDARIFFVTELMNQGSKGVHPMDAAANENLKAMGMLWADAPRHKLGPHDGLTDARRKIPSPSGSRRRKRPDAVVHWRDLLEKMQRTFPDSKEHHGFGAMFDRRAWFSRIGVHLEVLKPGRRTSLPHAKRDEDAFVYVVSGRVDAWNDGHITLMEVGDFIGWEAGTGITHTILNNSDADAILIVGGEALRARGGVWYPLHPKLNRRIGALYWADHPAPKLGPHDGLPDAMRNPKPCRTRR